MKKISITGITDCNQCPFNHFYVSSQSNVCTANEKEYKRLPNDWQRDAIPEWCPLEEDEDD